VGLRSTLRRMLGIPEPVLPEEPSAEEVRARREMAELAALVASLRAEAESMKGQSNGRRGSRGVTR